MKVGQIDKYDIRKILGESFYSVKYGSSNVMSFILSKNLYEYKWWVSRYFFETICNISIPYTVLFLI